ncbi:MAG: tRNA (N6-threonylcarbamoyladenosine(37)-N6)-methyltransferase TrmO [Proteobacteria bacterium]|nr:tRNA (N6-threonylcarbamoyladenosine(37)-N6)-methyltransferase TrmO [Pseudomonadota bacterium]
MNEFTVRPIGVFESCFVEKFGVPRQSGMAASARGVIRFREEFSAPSLFLHLEGFSHLWVVYLFHKAQNPNHPSAWKPTVTPPRIGGPSRVGVFASRSPHRPNPVGLSVVKIETIRRDRDGCMEIEVSGVDVLDGSPVIDVKPYLPYADSIQGARGGWAEGEIPKYRVEFLPAALEKAERLGIRVLLEELLEYDPRPRSQREAAPIGEPASVGRCFAFRLRDQDVRWRVAGDSVIEVMELVPTDPEDRPA